MSKEQPYLEQTVTHVQKLWNPKFDQEARCICGHKYYRHFDTYENMANVGCKYCDCRQFVASSA